LHNGADAGALAGALYVKFNPEQARTSAISTAACNFAEQLSISVDENLSNEPTGELVLGRWIRQLRQFIPTTIAPNAVKVVSRRKDQRDNAPLVGLIFGPIVNVDELPLEVYSTAWSLGSTGAGIIVLAEDPNIYKEQGWSNKGTGLLMDGGTVVDLRGVDPLTGEPMIGDIQVNSFSTDSPWDSFRLDGSSAEIWAGEFNICGTSNPDADDAGKWESLYADAGYPFSVNPYVDPVPDPLAGLTPPNVDGMIIPISEEINDSYVAANGEDELDAEGNLTGVKVLTLSPGYYPSGINITNGGTRVILSGGADAIYALGGGSNKNKKSGLISNGGSLIANGVMIYVIGDLDGSHPETGIVEWGKIDIGGNAPIEITSRGDAMEPPQIDGEIGVAIWQDRDNPTYGTIAGSSSISIDGTIYCGYNPMKISGTPNQCGSQLIAGALWLSGTVSLNIAYDGRNSIEAYRSILVE